MERERVPGGQRRPSRRWRAQLCSKMKMGMEKNEKGGRALREGRENRRKAKRREKGERRSFDLRHQLRQKNET